MDMVDLYEKKKEQDRIRQARRYAKNKVEINKKRQQKRLQLTQPDYKPPVEIFNQEYTEKKLKEYFESNPRNSKGSETQYLKSLKTLFQIVQSNDLSQFLNDYKEVIDKINNATYQSKDGEKPYKVNSKKSLIQTILFCIDNLHLPISNEIKQKYVSSFETFKLDSIDENEVKQLEPSVYSFTQYLKKIKEVFGDLSKEYVMASLYQEITVRDDFYLKIIPDISDATIQTQNYLVVPEKTRLPYEVIINNFKTKNKYEQLKFEIKGKLKTLLKKYIETLPDKEFLFGNAKKNSDFVSKMNKEIGVNGGISELRKMKISTLFKQDKIKDNEAKVKLAREMGHSPAIQKTYLRKIIEGGIN